MSTASPSTKLEKRPPVVTVLGHIDHGKSTLLDFIRKSNTTAGEAGGITQHLQGYEVEREHEGAVRRITFLDTPGHEAFQGMRSRGAQAADIAILIVAADDGVKTQTLEAIQAIQEAQVPYVVAINKIDKSNADVPSTISGLIEHGIYLEGYGGDISYANISAKTGEGIDTLLDLILLTADVAELTGDPSVPAEGVIIETNVDPRAGISATLLIKNGSLEQGKYIQAGTSTAPVRLMQDFTGTTIKKAQMSSPVRITGFDSAPEVGVAFHTWDKRKQAEEAAEEYAASPEAQLEETLDATEADTFILPLVIKTDVIGTQEAILHEVRKLATEKARFQVLETGLGNINDNDVRLAGSSAAQRGIVVGFNVGIEGPAREQSKRYEVPVESFTIIYELADWLKERLSEATPRHTVREVTGKAKVLKTFSAQRSRQIIGGRVTEGRISTGSSVIIKRRDEEIGEGKVQGLQQQKVAATEIAEGNEFGAQVDSRIEIAPGDILEAYILKEE